MLHIVIKPIPTYSLFCLELKLDIHASLNFVGSLDKDKCEQKCNTFLLAK